MRAILRLLERSCPVLLVISALACEDSEGPTGDSQLFCGGVAGLQCPDGLVCIDDPTDDCDPNTGDVDCGGVCIISDQVDSRTPR
jgi:hypothetical protein